MKNFTKCVCVYEAKYLPAKSEYISVLTTSMFLCFLAS